MCQFPSRNDWKTIRFPSGAPLRLPRVVVHVRDRARLAARGVHHPQRPLEVEHHSAAVRGDGRGHVRPFGHGDAELAILGMRRRRQEAGRCGQEKQRRQRGQLAATSSTRGDRYLGHEVSSVLSTIGWRMIRCARHPPGKTPVSCRDSGACAGVCETEEVPAQAIRRAGRDIGVVDSRRRCKRGRCERWTRQLNRRPLDPHSGFLTGRSGRAD